MAEKLKSPLAGMHSELKSELEHIGEMPILRMMNIRHNFNRVNPTIWLFFFAIIGILVGLAFVSFRVLLWVGGTIVIIYIALWILWYFWK